MDAIQIAIHAAIVDTTLLDEEIIKHKAARDLAENFHKKDWLTPLRSIWYYFTEKETRQRYQEKHRAQLQSNNKSNTFFHPERTAFSYRSNINFHYEIGTKTTGKKSSTFTDSQLNNLANDYILGQNIFAEKSDDEAKALFISTFQEYTTNNKQYAAFVTKECKKCQTSSDLLLQLQSYRANIAIVKKLLAGEGSAVQKEIDSFVMRYQQLPLALRLLEVQKIDQALENSLATPETKAKLEQLLTPLYEITLHIVPPTTSFGEYNLARSPYSGAATRIGLLWKRFPWRTKVIVIGGVIAATAFLGGWTLLALPLFIFVKQFCKTKADYLESIQGYLGRFASHNSIEQSRHTAAMQQQTKRGKKTKDTAMIYTALQPDLLRNPTYASTLTKNIIKSVITNNHEAIKAHVDTALAHCRFQAKHNVPTFAVERPQQKEQTLLYLHKTIVLGATLVGYNLTNATNTEEFTNATAYTSFTTNYQKTVQQSASSYAKHTNYYAFRDGLMSGVVTGFTGWIGAYLWPTLASTSVAYAAGEMFELTLSQDNPLYEYLVNNDIDPDTEQFTQEEIQELIAQDESVRLEGENIVYTSDAKNLDSKLLTEIQTILNDEQYQQFIDHLQSDKEATLWDTMIAIAGRESGNQLSHDIVNQIWKADSAGSSEIFLTSVENGLPISDPSHEQWDDILALLGTTYNYEGLEAYQQWIDKSWLIDTMQDLSNENFSVEKIASYTAEQRAVLTQASFINIDTSDITSILLDYSAQEEVIGSVRPVGSTSDAGFDNDSFDGSSETEGTVGTVQDSSNDSDAGSSTNRNPRRQLYNDGTTHATPIPYGKNTVIAGPNVSPSTVAQTSSGQAGTTQAIGTSTQAPSKQVASTSSTT